MLLQHKKS